MSQGQRVTLEVLGEQFAGRATRTPSSWTIVCDMFPEVQSCARDFGTAKGTLEKRLRPMVEAWRKRRDRL